MSNKILFQNLQLNNIPTSKKTKPNNDNNSKKKNMKQTEKFKSPNSLNFKNIKYISDNNELNSSNKKQNIQTYSIDNKKKYKNNSLNKRKNEFISISEFPENDYDNIYDNLNYINIIQNSIIESPDSNPEKIKTVDANRYTNNDNNSLSTFKDLKLKLLNKQNKFNSPFIFYRNNIDFANTKKLENEKNYQIKRYRYLKNYKYSFNPVIRRKNSKIIQKWWRSKIEPKIDKRKKIIKIQSAFRGHLTRKNLNDIICISVIYQNFINKLQKALGNYVHRNYFPKRYYKKKYAFEKIFPLKLKLFFRKWKNIKDKLSERDRAVDFLYKNRQKKRYVLLVLKTYFHIWKLKCEQFRKNEDKILSLKNQNQKYIALSKLFSKLEKISNKNAYNLSKDKIYKYLIYIFHNKYLKKLLELYNKNKLKRNLKKYLDIWRNNAIKEKEKTLKLKLLANEIKAQIRKNDKDFIRNNLNNLRAKTNLKTINNLKRAKKEFIFPEGIRHITTCIRKNIIRLILKEYIRKMNAEKKLSKIIEKKMMKYYLNKWYKLMKDLLYKDKCLLYLKKIILKINHLSNNITIAKYFNKWKSKILMNKFKNQKINNYNKFCNSLKQYINNNKKFRKIKKMFLTQKLNEYININGDIIRKKILKCFNNYVNRDKILGIKKCLNKWKKYVQFCKLNDLKAKNLQTVSRLTKLVYDSKKLSKNLYQWKNKNDLIILTNKYKYKDNINNLINCLSKMKNDRMKQLFNNLRISKYNLLKKIILKNISNKFTRNVISHYFNKYKINTIKLQNKYKLSNLDKLNKLKHITNKAIKKEEKITYGALKKYLYKWYLISKLINKENYKQFLMNIKKSIKIINSILTENALRDPFNNIIYSKINEKNIALQRLKKYFIKNDKNNLRNAFHKFLKNTQKYSQNILKSNIIYNVKAKNEKIRNKILLTKYFNKWKMLNNIYKKNMSNNTTLITNIIKKIIKRIKQKKFFKYMKIIKYKNDIKYLSKKLYEIYNKVEKRSLSKFLNKWNNNAKKLSLRMNQKEKGYNMIYRTLSKAYSYKKLEEVLIPLIVKCFKKKYYNEFIEKFKKIFWNNINCKYNKSIIKRGISAKKYNFKFKKTIKPNYPIDNDINLNKDEKNEKDEKNKNIEESKIISAKPRLSRYKIPKMLLNRRKSNFTGNDDKSLKNIIIPNSSDTKKDKFYLERLMPYLINYLNDLRLNRLRQILEHFLFIKKHNLFCILLKSWNKKQNYSYKRNLIQSLKQSNIRMKLYSLIKKSIIRKLTKKYLVEISRRNNLLILLHKINVYKKINRRKRTIRFIRIWRVYVKFLKDRAAQLERFEKSFSETYEKLSDSIFVDIGEEKSVQTQVMCFLDKIGNDEKNKIKNNLGVSQCSLNSYLSGKSIINNDINNDILNNCFSNFTFHNDNESNNISMSRYSNYDKSVNNSINNSTKNIKSAVFTRTSKNK